MFKASATEKPNENSNLGAVKLRFIIATHVQSFLNVHSSSPDPKDQCPGFSLKNGGVSCAIELKRPVGTHCHGPEAVVGQDRGDKQVAKKKLYIASAVCLLFMIGEVIGKTGTSVLVLVINPVPQGPQCSRLFCLTWWTTAFTKSPGNQVRVDFTQWERKPGRIVSVVGLG